MPLYIKDARASLLGACPAPHSFGSVAGPGLVLVEGAGMPSTATGNDAGLADPLLPGGDGTGRAAGASSKDKNKNWVPADEEEVLAAEERGGEDGRPLLYRTFKVRGILLHPYRYVVGYF